MIHYAGCYGLSALCQNEMVPDEGRNHGAKIPRPSLLIQKRWGRKGLVEERERGRHGGGVGGVGVQLGSLGHPTPQPYSEGLNSA